MVNKGTADGYLEVAKYVGGLIGPQMVSVSGTVETE